MTGYTFNQLFDFTRTTSGTFVGSNGLIQNTPASVNLLTFTQQFDDAAWSKTNTTVTANSTVAPDGTSTADTLTASAGAGAGQQVFQTITNIGSGNYVFSIYVKQGSGATDSNFFLVRNQTTGVNPAIISFNYQTGVVTQTEGSGATAVSVGNGWWRLSIPFTLTATIGNAIRFYAGSSGAVETPGEFFYAWGAQLEVGSTVTTYTRNNGGVFPARFDYDPVSLAPKGIMIEEPRTNLLLRSEEFDNAAWGKAEATVTANAAVAPDGTTTADLMVPSVNASPHSIFSNITPSAAQHAGSVYVKLQSGSLIDKVTVYNGGSGTFANFNISNLTVSPEANVVSASIENAGNGWYRLRVVWATITPTTSLRVYASSGSIGASPTVGNGTSGIFLWGAQLEAGAFATSYIPTVASQVTRSADVCTITAPMFAPWYNQSAGTFVAEGSTFSNGSTGFVTASAPSTVDYMHIRRGAGAPSFRIQTSAGVQGDFGTITNTGKTAAAYSVNDFAVSSNGGAVSTDTLGAVPTVTSLELGALYTAFFLNGHIRSIKYYPFRASNNQLQALTI